jgi:hypothetical protein
VEAGAEAKAAIFSVEGLSSDSTSGVSKTRQQRQTRQQPAKQDNKKETRYGWMPHNASFGFLDLAPSIRHSNWFWDYIF